MRLIIDFGNTLTKVALYKNNKEIKLQSINNITKELLKAFILEQEANNSASTKITHCIVSSVINYPSDIREFLKSQYYFIALNPKTPIPIEIKYKTPNTLGQDRIAAAVAGNSMFPDHDVLIVDAGTCITFDYINKKGEYLGGAISPGINLRFKALNNYTDNLPLIRHFGEKEELVGKSTTDSIKSGVINGVKAEINGILELYKTKYPGIKIIFTGGNINYFDTTTKNNIFAVANLVLKGLNTILDYNVKN